VQSVRRFVFPLRAAKQLPPPPPPQVREIVRSIMTDPKHLTAADDLPALHSLADGFLRDEAAVTAGLTLPWNSGPVEGAVTRIKFLKRQCFGRAKFDLLRKRILLTA
jgi:hypothetical protein